MGEHAQFVCTFAFPRDFYPSGGTRPSRNVAACGGQRLQRRWQGRAALLAGKGRGAATSSTHPPTCVLGARISCSEVPCGSHVPTSGQPILQGKKIPPPFAGNSAPPTALQLVPTSRSRLGRVPPAQVISQSFTSVILRERDRTGLKSKPEHR